MSDADDLIDALYAEWLMTQPEACIYNGDRLVVQMERRWGWDRFIEQLPANLQRVRARGEVMDRPILFSGPMVRAILDGRKTQTRRVLTPQPQHQQYHEYKGKVLRDAEHRMWCWKDLILDNIWDFPDGDDRKTLAARCPYGVPGDRLWVRETWRWMCPDDPDAAIYRADGHEASTLPRGFKWRPSIYMPRAASRITLDIVSVRVERLQEISEADAKAEGVDNIKAKTPTHRDAYRYLWDDINGERAPWATNPWVWAITFRPTAREPGKGESDV